jgi:hypothetical protein
LFIDRGSLLIQTTDQPLKKIEWPSASVGFRNPTTVPKRFSIGAFLGITTLWSVLILGLQQMNAPNMIYFFLGIQLFLVCIAQMRFEKSPRWASFVVGGVVMYGVVLIASRFPYEGGRSATTMFTATQFFGFWGGDNYMVYRMFRRRMDDIWVSQWIDELLTLLFSLGLGGAYGYAMGAFTAGVFLIGNRISHWFEPPVDPDPQPKVS